MKKIDKLLSTINSIIQKAKDDDTEEALEIAHFPGLEDVPGYIEQYEKDIAKLFRKQRRYFVNGIMDITVQELLETVTGKLFGEDTFADEMSALTSEFLSLTMTELTTQMMAAIDKEISFETFSTRTTDWIESWASDLGKLMKLNTHTMLETELKAALENGESIEQAIQRIKDLPGFDRARAKKTAITEVLTACSRSQYEAYSQSPAVIGKTWRHSGTRNNNAREDHMDIDGVTVAVDEYFDVGGENALYPRDTNLSAKQRVSCHCALGPQVDESILGLSKEEKEKIRQEALENMK